VYHTVLGGRLHNVSSLAHAFPFVSSYCWNCGEICLAVVMEVPATVHVPAAVSAVTDEPGTVTSESSAPPVIATRQTDVYSTLKLDVTVDSIQLQLFTGDSDLVS